jgi:adenylate cyclase
LKFRLWLIAIPIIVIFSLIQATFDWGEQGKLESNFLRKEIYPLSKNVNGIMTNIKFKIRGTQPHHPDIVIVTADDASVEKLGRWPWHREIYAQIIYSIFEMGAKHVAMDVVFSEPEERIPVDIYNKIKKLSPKLEKEIKEVIDGDSLFAKVIEKNREKLVLGYIPTSCQPFYDKQDCPVDNQFNNESVLNGIGKFALKKDTHFTLDSLKRSPMSNILAGIFPIPAYHDAAQNAGYFEIIPDPDGYVRRYPLIMIGNNKVYSALSTKMAELIKEDELNVEFKEDTRVEKIYFSKNPENPIPATKLGYIDLNFKGPRETFPYISALDVLLAVQGDDPATTARVKSALEGKEVFFGVSAIGLYDMRAFPFDSNTPGVEGHATALNNLLSMDSLKSASSIKKDWLPLTLIILIGLLFSILFSALEAVPGLLLFLGFVIGFQYIDIIYLFKHNNINLPTALIYLETFTIFALILSIRYIIEERKKKNIKAAFSHYLAPSVVDMVLKDPSKLAVGGERRELTILFSDLRGFTTISEGMDPKTLSQFLNEYLTSMTDCVFENEGTLDKYIGDAVMAFWGAPIYQDDHILRACTAACLMQKKLAAIAPDFKQRYNIDVGMGVGVNSGTVSVGNMGSQKIFEYTVLGDHVNLASRLEGLTRIYGVGVLSTKNTMEILEQKHPGKINYRVLDSVKVKGKRVATDLVELSLDPFSKEADELFQQSRKLFMSRNWDEAKKSFEQSNRIYYRDHGLEDPVANMYINRCEYYKTHPPVENWDGSIEMKEK